MFARCAAMLALLPPLNARQFPLTLRVGLGVVLAAALLPAVPQVVAAPQITLLAYSALLVREAAVGLAMGLAAALVFWAFLVAGQLLDALLGAGDSRARASGRGPVAGLVYLLAAGVFVAVDGHHWLLGALADSLRVLPPGGAIDLGGVAAVGEAARVMLGAGVLIAAPAMAAIYAAEVALAAFDRIAPGLGLSDCAQPVRWTSGLLGLVVCAPLVVALVAEHGARAAEAASAAVSLLAGSP
ncbi:MAG: flagellar biosynthetic protein FliR [Armatimonadota bacterium]|nr:flagellar biosynthetic protein FliR [Armatimonadota bacterium]